MSDTLPSEKETTTTPKPTPSGNATTDASSTKQVQTDNLLEKVNQTSQKDGKQEDTGMEM
jgi:hypothetical protein